MKTVSLVASPNEIKIVDWASLSILSVLVSAGIKEGRGKELKAFLVPLKVSDADNSIEPENLHTQQISIHIGKTSLGILNRGNLMQGIRYSQNL